MSPHMGLAGNLAETASVSWGSRGMPSIQETEGNPAACSLKVNSSLWAAFTRRGHAMGLFAGIVRVPTQPHGAPLDAGFWAHAA